MCLLFNQTFLYIYLYIYRHTHTQNFDKNLMLRMYLISKIFTAFDPQKCRTISEFILRIKQGNI